MTQQPLASPDTTISWVNAPAYQTKTCKNAPWQDCNIHKYNFHHKIRPLQKEWDSLSHFVGEEPLTWRSYSYSVPYPFVNITEVQRFLRFVHLLLAQSRHYPIKRNSPEMSLLWSKWINSTTIVPRAVWKLLDATMRCRHRAAADDATWRGYQCAPKNLTDMITS